MVSISLPDLATGRPKKVSSWTQANHRGAFRIAMMALRGVGVVDKIHSERATSIWTWRRPATDEEALALPDVGIAGEYKRRLKWQNPPSTA